VTPRTPTDRRLGRGVRSNARSGGKTGARPRDGRRGVPHPPRRLLRGLEVRPPVPPGRVRAANQHHYSSRPTTCRSRPTTCRSRLCRRPSAASSSRRHLVGRLPQCRRQLVERGRQLAPLLITVASAADLERRLVGQPLGFPHQHRKRRVPAAHRIPARCPSRPAGLVPLHGGANRARRAADRRLSSRTSR